MLTLQLEQQLSAKATQRDNLRQQLAAHNAVFEEVIKRVFAVHCAERGALLDKLRKFYCRSTEATTRLAEESMKKQLEESLNEVEEENKALKKELRKSRAIGLRPDGSCSAEVVQRLFASLSEAEQSEAFVHIASKIAGSIVEGQCGEGQAAQRSDSHMPEDAVLLG